MGYLDQFSLFIRQTIPQVRGPLVFGPWAIWRSQSTSLRYGWVSLKEGGASAAAAPQE